MKRSTSFLVHYFAGVVMPLLVLFTLYRAAPVFAAVPVKPAPSLPAVQKPGRGRRFVQVRLRLIRVDTKDLAEKLTVFSMRSNPGNGQTVASGSEAAALFDALKLGPPEAGASSSVVTQDAHPVSASLHPSSHSLGVTAGEGDKPVDGSITVTVTPRINLDQSITLRLAWIEAAGLALREPGREAHATVDSGEMIMLRAFPVDAQTEMLLLATPTPFPDRPSEGAGTNSQTKAQSHLSGELISRFHQDLGGGLLPVGTTAPAFTLPTPFGERVSLEDALRGNKALILSFWFIGCSPCRVELPHLQGLYNQFHSRGLGVLAVDNRGDTPGTLWAFSHKNRLTFPVALDPERVPDIDQDARTWKHTISGQYRAGGAPIIYIIGPSGKVMWREIGYDADTEKRIRTILADFGIEWVLSTRRSGAR